MTAGVLAAVLFATSACTQAAPGPAPAPAPEGPAPEAPSNPPAAPPEGATPAPTPAAYPAPEPPDPLRAPDEPVRERILETVRTLFRGMERKDAGLLGSVLLPGARVLSVPDLEGPEEWITGKEFVRRVLAAEEHLLERMSDPLVRVDDPLAHVWAPYDFWRDGEFSHCGTDSFQLIRTTDGWRIVAIAYTLHPAELCPERDPPEQRPPGPGARPR